MSEQTTGTGNATRGIANDLTFVAGKRRSNET
jgi:hypothetical protein